MKIRALILSLILASSLQACSIWDFIKPNSGISVDTEIVSGDKEETVATEVVGNKETTHNKADTITQTYNTINESMSWWMWVLMIVGWMTPTPTNMWRSLMNVFRGNKNGR